MGKRSESLYNLMMECMTESLKYRKWWLAAGYTLVAIVVYLSLHPSPPDTRGVFMGDKLLHGLTYIVLTVWFCQLYQQHQFKIVAASLFILGVFVEIAQWGTGYRFFELADIVANSSGIVIGWLLALKLLSKLFLSIEKLLIKPA